jgi:DNA primase
MRIVDIRETACPPDFSFRDLRQPVEVGLIRSLPVKARIFIDYFRNTRGATAIAPYSTRALQQASVSTPLEWEELSQDVRADHFRVDNLRQRLDFLSKDPWQGYFTIRQKLLK